MSISSPCICLYSLFRYPYLKGHRLEILCFKFQQQKDRPFRRLRCLHQSSPRQSQILIISLLLVSCPCEVCPKYCIFYTFCLPSLMRRKIKCNMADLRFLQPQDNDNDLAVLKEVIFDWRSRFPPYAFYACQHFLFFLHPQHNTMLLSVYPDLHKQAYHANAYCKQEAHPTSDVLNELERLILTRSFFCSITCQKGT